MTGANQAQRDAWNGDSGQRWAADADRRDAVLAPVADALLAAAHLTSGEDVLDIGCGCGITTHAAAAAVRPGTAMGVDLSTPMLDLARQRAGADDAITFVQDDAQTHRFTPDAYDVAISRFGTMFFDDPVAAFTNIASALRPTGRLCIATWQALDANPWLLVPGAALLRYGSLPDTGGSAPGMFAQSDPVVVTTVLAAAGWHDITVEPVTLSMRLGANADEATDYLASTGIARSVLDTIEPSERERAVAAVTETLAAHAGPDGVHLDGGIQLIRATRP
ncbi:MAG: class I SAM-dependent methyltransferase [Microthrixaceae bacterium]